MKRFLLGTSAIVGSVLFAGPALAGPVSAGDSFDLSLGGNIRYSFVHDSEDQTLSRGRGYRFYADEVEVWVKGSKKGDNGLLYGFEIELNGSTTDGTASDESWMFVDANWGRVELGDQDDATDRMAVTGENAMVGRLGFDEDVAENFFFGAAIGAPFTTITDDATKVIYFTPRFTGFQLGASFTPDSGQTGFTRDADNDGDFENVLGAGLNYVGTFGAVGVTLSAVGEWGSSEVAAPAAGASEHDVETYALGALVTFSGFSLGAGWADLDKQGIVTTTTADAGEWWNVGAGYRTGPWGFSVGYYESEIAQGNGFTAKADILSFDVEYTVAPGWLVMADLSFVGAKDIDAVGTDNDGHVFILSNDFIF